MPTRVPYDPELVPMMERILGFADLPLTADKIAGSRAMSFVPPLDSLLEGTFLERREWVAGDVEITSVAGPSAGSTAIFALHGGGMVSGDRLSGSEHLVLLARELPVVVLSPEYRLAPEHPYPAAVDDALAAWLWVQEHASELGVDPARIVLLGESAGGGIAAGLALRLRDEGHPLPLALALLAPMLDERNDSGSARAYDGFGLWDRISNETGWTALLGPAPRSDVPAYGSPAHATDLTGLPATYLEVGTSEVFRDEVVAFAAKLWEAGVQAELHVWGGVFHAAEFISPDARVSTTARRTRLGWLERVINR